MFQRISVYLYFVLNSFLFISTQVIFDQEITREDLSFSLENHNQDATYQYRIPFDGVYYDKFQLIVIEEIPMSKQETTSFLSNYQLNCSYGVEKKKEHLVVQLTPFRKDEFGNIFALRKFEINANTASEANNPKSRSRSYAEESVLKSGMFVKFSVQESGVYKLSYESLETAGLENLSDGAWDVSVYSNSGSILAENTNNDEIDDLVKHSILKLDNNNNATFDNGDEILFFAEGPHQWKYNEEFSTFDMYENYYSDESFVFVTKDGTARIAPFVSSGGSFDEEVNEFDALFYEGPNNISLIKSGRTWWNGKIFSGDQFNYNLDETHLVTGEPIFIKSAFAVKSGQSGNLSFFFNGSQFRSHSFSGISSGDTQPEARIVQQEDWVNADSENLQVSVKMNAGGGNETYDDFISLHCRKRLSYSLANNNGQFIFRDAQSNNDNVVKFVVEDVNTNVRVLRKMNSNSLEELDFTQNGSSLEFITSNDVNEFIVFDPSELVEPKFVSIVKPQNLHGLGFYDYLIVTNNELRSAAEELAEFHRTYSNLSVHVATTEQIFNEFSAGRQDVSAIRNYVKMFYDRAQSEDQMPKYLLLFGDGSYDYKNRLFPTNNTNLVPTYQSKDSAWRIYSYCSDDYYGFLDDGEGENIQSSSVQMDIALGRIPAKDINEANSVVQKIKHYKNSAVASEWLNQLTFVADDEDSNLHFNDSERHTSYVADNYQNYNIDKIYLDSYTQEAGANGTAYPLVNQSINSAIFNGTFCMNYVGHGGEVGWAHEKILNVESIRNWTNIDKLPLFITATCSFSRFDDPARTSAGEYVLLNENGGGVAIVTTVRLVFSHSNYELNNAFLRFLFVTENGANLTVGEVLRRGKNDIDQNANNRKFVLLGDPALTLNYPTQKVATTSINEVLVSEQIDTIKGLQKVTVKGEVQNQQNQVLSSFNGKLAVSVFDKELEYRTLGQDEKSFEDEFMEQNGTIFKGLASVNNGNFEFSFIIPKDVNPSFGLGKISYLAFNDDLTAAGYGNDFVVGGVDENVLTDDQGPKIDIFLDDQEFVFGGITNENPVLILRLEDENGINTVGTGIGHDIKAVLDENLNDSHLLNHFYKAKENDYTTGEVVYPLFELEPGIHQMEVKAWDVLNNSTTAFTEFVVESSATMALQRILNYPNPFFDQTSFWIEHNQKGKNLSVRIQIFSISGRLIKTIQREVFATGNRITDITWNGRDEFDQDIGKGVYIYNVQVSTPDASITSNIEKLVLLK